MTQYNTPVAADAAPRMGALLFQTQDPNGLHLTVVPAESWDIVPAGWFVVQSPMGIRSYCRFTGRTSRHWHMACPTVERYDIDTVVRERPDGVHALFGEAGERIPGMWAVRADWLV